MEIVFVWLLLSIGVGVLANSRGRSGFGFFMLAAIISPLLGVVVVLVSENRVVTSERDLQRRRDHEQQLESIRAIAARNQHAETVAKPHGLAPGASVADELAKLAKLRDQSILTEAEFQEQKRAMLAGGQTSSSGIVIHRPRSPAPAPTATAGPMGNCPNCSALIPLASKACPDCKAMFGGGSEWAVRPLP